MFEPKEFGLVKTVLNSLLANLRTPRDWSTSKQIIISFAEWIATSAIFGLVTLIVNLYHPLPYSYYSLSQPYHHTMLRSHPELRSLRWSSEWVESFALAARLDLDPSGTSTLAPTWLGIDENLIIASFRFITLTDLIYIYMWYIMIIINELWLLQISSWSLDIFWYLLISLHHFCFFREQNRGADQWGGGHQTRVHQVQAPSAALCHWDWKDIKDSWRCWGQGTQMISN